MPTKDKKLKGKPFLLAPSIFALQSIPLLASGLYTLISPAAAATLPNSPMQGLGNGTIQALSLTSLSLGAFYAIASWQNNVPLMMTAVPGRLLAMVVFYRSGGGWRAVAPFEGVMGVLTAVGLWWDWRSASARVEKGE